MILTIAKIIVIWMLASIPAALIVSRLIGANERAGVVQPEPLRRGGEVDFHKIHDPLIIEGAKQDHV